MKLIGYLICLSIVFIAFMGGRNTKNIEKVNFSVVSQSRDYREDMREFVVQISTYAKEKQPGFVVIPQNGIELVTHNGEATGMPSTAYLNAIDAHGQESLFYGYKKDNKATPKETNNYTIELLDVSKNSGNHILVTDYCSSVKKMTKSIQSNSESGYISFAANQRNLTNIPSYPKQIFKENSDDIHTINEAENFLYLINFEEFESKEEFINVVAKTNYDALIIDLFFNDGSVLEKEDIQRLKVKANGATRKVICYMSIGEAEDYRYYWKNEWQGESPIWLDKENEDWAGNYKVKYWKKGWKSIIIGSKESYLDKVIASEFDGVYLDIIDAFEYYEEQ
ncbi:MAG: endo alpha-1,4 polygalactosaminidase [Cellulophaga sp.]